MRSTPRPKRREEQREDAPAHAVVEIVDQARLRGREQVAVAERGEDEDLAGSSIGSAGCVWPRRFEAHMLARVAHEQDRQHEPEDA